MVDDVDAFVPWVLEVDLNTDRELPPTTASQVERGLTERMEHKHMSTPTHKHTFLYFIKAFPTLQGYIVAFNQPDRTEEVYR